MRKNNKIMKNKKIKHRIDDRTGKIITNDEYLRNIKSNSEKYNITISDEVKRILDIPIDENESELN